MNCLVLLALLHLQASPSSALFFKQIFSPDPVLESACPGNCMLCTSCWLSGGQVAGYCGGLLQICCRTPPAQPAQARKIGLGTSATSADVEPLQDIEFGPVVNDPACGRPVVARRRVVGGRDAGFGRFPWQALIRVGHARCGGALINRQHVVTAGHCVHNTAPYGVRVFLGEYSLFRETEPLPRQEFGVASIQKHPYYRFSPQADRYDVAVLRLDRPVRYEPHIAPICLPMKGEMVPEGTEAMVSGWGATKPDSRDRPVDLQVVDVKIVDSSKCERWHAANNIQVNILDDMMCAGYEEGGKDACQGDSGGPLMVKTEGSPGDGDGVWTLVGVVSAGFSCARPGQPGIYHRVSKTADWISYAARRIP